MSAINQGISLQLSTLLIFISLFTLRAMAQVKSDGTTNTIVNVNGNDFTILNGIEKGNNLFHSFSNFSIPTGGSASFDLSNTPNVTTIFSRVTGGNISNIDGLIQTINGNSPVSLYLMNPAGIVFGKNASLNISGSFIGTTANSIKFSDGVEFNATASTPPLLTMSVPIGLQMGQNAAPIQVQGNLTTGLDLTLQAGSLDLQGQLVAGRDLTLNAQDTVQIGDTTGPFLAQAGRNLTIQGNQNIDILALNQPNPALQSGGNLSLISDGNISGDAHFLSGGNVSFQTLSGDPGNFVSQFDPVIYANGNVVFGYYNGVALKVEATGSIQAGYISITGPDTTVSTTDPDYKTLATQPAVILEAGVISVPTPNLPQVGVGNSNTSFTTGTVAGLPPGSISVVGINTSPAVGNGGSITLVANGDIIISDGQLNSSSYGNGGAITVSTTNGNIYLPNNSSFYSSGGGQGTVGNGGAITVSATNGNISLDDGGFDSAAGGTVGNGGAITVSATNGNISLDNSTFYSAGGNGGTGGAITASATNGNISLTGNSQFNSGTNGGTGGAITASVTNGNISLDYSHFYSGGGNGGNGGAITASATNGNISLTDHSEFNSEGGTGESLGNGGAIALSTTNGNVSLEDYSLLFSAASGGNGGAITASATNGNISLTDNSEIQSYASAPDNVSSQNGGAITLSATNGISNQANLESFSFSQQGGSSGQGGAITLFSQNSSISNQGNLDSFSVSNSPKWQYRWQW